MKKYNVTIGIDYQDTAGRRQTTCLNRDGQTIGFRHYLNGQCNNMVLIDNCSRDLMLYFVDESDDVLKIADKK